MLNETTFTSFESISDFKICLDHGGEIEFEWNGNSFGIFKYMKKSPEAPEQIFIGPSNETENKHPNTYPCWFVDTVDEVLNYVIDEEKLRNIVTKIEVLWRNV